MKNGPSITEEQKNGVCDLTCKSI